MPLLHWLTREEDIRAAGRAPFRLLEEVSSHGDPESDSMLIRGDNLDALKALLPRFAGAVKCVCIDPPYNTGSAFEHYDDNVEHSRWLSLMYPRLELLRRLLREDGVIWIFIDDDEAHYMKVICDEIFGRKNFIRNIVWQKRTSPDARLNLGDAHEHILVYGKDKNLAKQKLYKIMLSDARAGEYKNPDNDPRGPWASVDCTGQTGHATENQFYDIVLPNGDVIKPPKNRCWALSKETFLSLEKDGRIWFGKHGKSRPRMKKFLYESDGVNVWSWWENTEVGHYQESKKEVLELFSDNGKIFDTPKPERLIRRILDISTQKDDLVLDSFLGSGTTAAVAHKMGRRWIGVEIGEHAETHCLPRLEKVIAGEEGGISKAVGWKGGGGFRFLRLGEPIFDEDGRIRPDVTFAQLAAHVWFAETGRCLEGAPDSHVLGVHEGTMHVLFYNGILKDRAPGGDNALNLRTLAILPPHGGPVVVHAARCLLGERALKGRGVEFRQIPYALRRS